MRIHLVISSFLILFCADRAQAFLPPLNVLLDNAFKERVLAPHSMFIFRHRVEPRPGQIIEIDEKILVSQGVYYHQWHLPQFGYPIGATKKTRRYESGGSVLYESASSALLEYFTATKSERFQRVLLSESLIRQENLLQYKPGFVPTGDPQTWDLMANYLTHGNVFLVRTKAGPALGIQGISEPKSQRLVVFDLDGAGLRGLYWQAGGNGISWQVLSTTKLKGMGVLPKTLWLEMGGRPVIQSELIQAHAVAQSEARDFVSQIQRSEKVGLSGDSHEALVLLTSYR